MASSSGAVPALYIFLALLIVPPTLLMLATLRRMLRAQAHGLPWQGLASALGVAAISLSFNLVVVLVTAPQLIRGDTDWSRLQLAGGVVSWLCFWGWMVLGLVRKRRRRAY